jgi:hypothetical protein
VEWKFLKSENTMEKQFPGFLLSSYMEYIESIGFTPKILNK